MIEIKKERKIVLLVFAVSLSLYLLTINQCCSIVLDSICYIADIARNELVFHPHHLVYHAVFLYWSKLLAIFGISDIVYAIPTINAIFSAFTLSVIYMIFRFRFELNRFRALLYLCLPAFSFGFWIVATSVNVYAVPLTFIMLCFYLFLGKKLSRKKWLAMGIAHSLAIIFNQWNVFIFFVITLSVLFSSDRKLLFRKYYIYYLLPAVLISAGAYLAVMIFAYGLHDFTSIYKWMTYYSEVFKWSGLGLTTIKQAVMGIGQTISAPYWLFQTKIFGLLFHSVMPNSSYTEEIYFCRNISSSQATIYLVMLIAIILEILYLLCSIIRNFRKTYLSNKKAVVYMSLWILVTSAMPFFWSGYNQRYWFTQSVVFFIFSALTSKNLNRRRKIFGNIVTITLAIMLFAINFFGTIVLSTDKKNDMTYNQIEPLTHKVNKGDLIIYKTPWNFGYYISTYLPGVNAIGLEFLEREGKLKAAENDLCNINKLIEKNNVYIFEDVFSKKSDLSSEIQKQINDIDIRYHNSMQYIHYKQIKYYKISK